MRMQQLFVLVVIALSLVAWGCGRGKVPDTPVDKPKVSVENLRMLVVSQAPKPVREDETGELTEMTNQWFEGFTKAFKAAALDAGFRVVEGGEHDVKVVLTGQSFDVRRDALNKTASVRAKITTGGKSQELLGEVAYELDDEEDFDAVSSDDRWMDKVNSHAWFAHKLFNEVVAQKRLIAMADQGSTGGGGAIASGKSRSKGKGKAQGFVTGAPQRNAYALIVGVEQYRDVKTPATGAIQDAQSFAKLAKTSMGLPEENIRLAVGDRATKGDLEKHVDWLVANVPKGGRVYLFFSGHGAPDGAEGTPYLLPYDGDPAALERTALPLQKILDRLQDSPAEDAVAFVDTCFSGAGGRSVLPEGARPLVRVKKPEAKAKVALLSASSGEQISGPSADKKNGAFTRFVTLGIGQGEADADGDGQITLKELAAWVTPRVEREARKQGRDQSPQLSSPTGARPDDMVVAHGVQ